MTSEELKQLHRLLSEWLRCTDSKNPKYRHISETLEQVREELWAEHGERPDD